MMEFVNLKDDIPYKYIYIMENENQMFETTNQSTFYTLMNPWCLWKMNGVELVIVDVSCKYLANQTAKY